MALVNWDVFKQLPGAADENFETLCRSLVRRHYERFGRFKQRANQPGVEFHLELTEPCNLGAPPQWIGWQCKWYGLVNGQDLGATRRKKIIEGIEKTLKHVPGVNVWKLWTYHTLTKDDQEWFYALGKERFPELKLELLTALDIEDLLVGPGALLRETYFGELVLTPELLAEQHRLAAAPFKNRYQSEVHVVVGAEKKIFRSLCTQNAWESLKKLTSSLNNACTHITSLNSQLKPEIKADVELLLNRVAKLTVILDRLYVALGKGDFGTVLEILESNKSQPVRYDKLLSKLRSARTVLALYVTNLVADIHLVILELQSLDESISVRTIAVLAAAGEGKSELAVKITQPDGEYLGGVFLLGKNLHAGQGFDKLVSAFKFSGTSVESIERLVEAVDAAGQREGKRIPIVIDGLNEAEDPRNWKDELYKADELLKRFPYVLLVVTLRNEFAPICLPEGFNEVTHYGFNEDLQFAINKYFQYYKIDSTDAALPIEFLQHPLTLKIFCEVANSSREHIVGVEALPSSLTSLFTAYFNKVASRVAELSPSSCQIYQDEVHIAMRKIAGIFWKSNTRSVEFQTVRKEVGDDGSWCTSVIRALESEGVLIRTTYSEGNQGIAFAYDLMAGHMIALYLLGTNQQLAKWLRSDEGSALFQFSKPTSHTFAKDVFQALVSLYPQHFANRQLWQELSDDKLVIDSLLQTVRSEPRYIGRETVERFAREMLESKQFSQNAFDRFKSTRAARAHPYDMDFLNSVLLAMSNTQRDLFWSEWVREKTDEIEKDFKFLSARWRLGSLDEQDIRRARWVMWTLTSTSRSLRDVATKTLYEFAIKQPANFFRLAVEAIAVSDTYVPERMFAAGYGAALATWSDLNAVEMRNILPKVAREIYQAMFAPGATHPTWHALYKQYCLGTIAIARIVDPTCMTDDEVANLLPPFSQLPSPFEGMPCYEPEVIERAKRAAIRMDFGNYTMGQLIPDRSNYDDSHPEYQKVLKAIVSRMMVLGYEPDKFEAVDRQMNTYFRMRDAKHKVDRYGKKYGWIAYFEMWGLRHAQGLLAEERGARTLDADIDPTFPVTDVSVNLELPDLFSNQPTDAEDWVVRGPQPNYSNILEVDEIEGVPGPWVVLDGFLEQNAPSDERQVFTFIRGLLVNVEKVEPLQKLFTTLKYPGNNAIPAIPEYYYTYAGEMPFLSIPGLPIDTAQQGDLNENLVYADSWLKKGVVVDIPVQQYNWERYHSVVNQSNGARLPSKQLCEELNLRYRANTWDLHNDSGVAFLYRFFGAYGEQTNGSCCYLRRDLLDNYLTKSGKTLVWLVWGERNLHHRSNLVQSLQESLANYLHIHKQFIVYKPISDT